MEAITINDPKSKGLNHEVIIDKLLAGVPLITCMVDEIIETKNISYTCLYILNLQLDLIRQQEISPAHIDNARGTCELKNSTYLLKEGKLTETDKISTTAEETFPMSLEKCQQIKS